MTAFIPTEPKTCAWHPCGAVFTRALGVSTKRWARRQYCSRTCGVLATGADAEARIRQAQSLKRRYEDPEFRERRRIESLPNIAKAKEAARLVAHKAGATRSHKMLGWLPDSMRPYYRNMRNQFGAAEAKRMIRDHMKIEGPRVVRQAKVDMRAKHEREQRDRY